MKFSDAIRLGAMLKPQAFGDFTDGVGTCALGAANMAEGRAVDNDLIPDDWKVVWMQEAVCPVCSVTADSAYALGTIVVHLNDDHKWTREAVAGWVASLEAAQDQPAPAVEARA